MLKKFFTTSALLAIFTCFSNTALAQTVNPANPSPDEYFRAEIISITEKAYEPPAELFKELGDAVDASLLNGGDGSTLQAQRMVQTINARILDNKNSGTLITITQGGATPISENQRVKQGDTAVVIKTYDALDGKPSYYIVDLYRFDAIGIIILMFLALAIIFGRIKGVTSLLGLATSVAILIWYIVPSILSGQNPLITTLIGSCSIALTTLYLAHGFTRRTTVAVGSTLITLGLAIGLATLFVSIAKLFGTGTEDALTLRFGTIDSINLQGLLLSGMIIGTLGVLDDITTAQTAVVDELHKANPTLSRSELYRRSLSVGREHIAALVNTLVLAYAGASLPLFLLFKLNNHLPLWVTLNSETIAEELVRTLVGSSALILAVPISTALAVWLVPAFPKSGNQNISSTIIQPTSPK